MSPVFLHFLLASPPSSPHFPFRFCLSVLHLTGPVLPNDEIFKLIGLVEKTVSLSCKNLEEPSASGSHL